jgi:hypothetical protein
VISYAISRAVGMQSAGKCEFVCNFFHVRFRVRCRFHSAAEHAIAHGITRVTGPLHAFHAYVIAQCTLIRFQLEFIEISMHLIMIDRH